MAARLPPGAMRGWAVLAMLCCAACAPRGTQDDGKTARLGEDAAIGRAAEMLESRPTPPPSEASPAPVGAPSPEGR